MRIIHIGRYRPDSANGVDKTIAGLAAGLVRDGVSCEIWRPDRQARSVREQRLEGNLTLVDLPFHRHALADAVGMMPACSRKFIESQTSGSTTIVHFHSVFTPNNILIAKWIRCPYVTTPNGGYMPVVLSGRRALLKKIWLAVQESAYLRNAAVLHAVSLPERDWLYQRFQHPRVVYIPNAVDRVSAHAATVSRRFAFLGRYAVEQKGLDRLLQAWSLCHAPARGWRLHMAGADFREGLKKLQSLAKSLKISSVEFSGPVFGEDKEAFYASGGVFVHTSRWEGMPFTLLEALSHGLPVLITHETNIAADVIDYDAGWVVDKNPKAIAEKMDAITALGTAALKQKSENAIKLIQERFTWEHVVTRILSVYLEALHLSGRHD